MPDAITAITLTVDGKDIQVASGSSVAAAVARAGAQAGTVTRRSVTGQPRGPLCGMGICQECRVTIDGCAHRLACQTLCAPGMRVVTGARA
jgi:predicted molibdopterin-dependent oxidoreductase YjgC